MLYLCHDPLLTLLSFSFLPCFNFWISMLVALCSPSKTLKVNMFMKKITLLSYRSY